MSKHQPDPEHRKIRAVLARARAEVSLPGTRRTGGPPPPVCHVVIDKGRCLVAVRDRGESIFVNAEMVVLALLRMWQHRSPEMIGRSPLLSRGRRGAPERQNDEEWRRTLEGACRELGVDCEFLNAFTYGSGGGRGHGSRASKPSAAKPEADEPEASEPPKPFSCPPPDLGLCTSGYARLF